MTFTVAMVHGVSSQLYAANEDITNPGQGSSQGTGSGPMLWLSTEDVALAAYKDMCPDTAITRPNWKNVVITNHSDMFVDDTTQKVNYTGITHPSNIA